MITSCNGCRVLRKGCTQNCLLRQSLNPLDSPLSQSHATLFVSKFFGRAPLLSFLSSVPPSLRPVMFQSLLYEACGRTINPVTGAVGLMYTGNWTLCQVAVEKVLRGEKPTPLKGFLDRQPSYSTKTNNVSDGEVVSVSKKRPKLDDDHVPIDLNLRLMTTVTTGEEVDDDCGEARTMTTSFASGVSETTSSGSGVGDEDGYEDEVEIDGKALKLFY